MALQRLKEQLKCPVCLDQFKDPKGLPCLHSFCTSCLEKLPVEQDAVKCPTCRFVTVLPTGGVAELPTAFHINALLEVHQTLQQPTADSGEDETETVPLCDLHGKPREFYCQEDDEVICSVCAIRAHKTHTCDTVAEYSEPAKAEIEGSLDNINESIKTIKEAINLLEGTVDCIKEQACEVKMEIHREIENLHKQIEVEKEKLLTKVDSHARHKLQKVAEKRETLTTVLTQFESCHEFIRLTLHSSTPQQILVVKRQLLNHMNALTLQMNINNSKSLRISNSAIYFNPMVTSSNIDIGGICQVQCDGCTISNNKRYATRFGKQLKFFIHIRNIDDSLTVLPNNHIIRCSHVANPEVYLNCSVDALSFGKYQVSCTPTAPGPHLIECLIGDRHICGSPFIARVLPVALQHHIRSIENLHIPASIAITANKHIIVGERGSYSIAVLDENGERIRTIGNKSQFGILSGIDITKEGSILVVDTSNNQLHQYTVDGDLQKSVGSDQFGLAYSVAVHPSGTVYVADRNKHCIHVFGSDFRYMFCFGSKGTKSGQFKVLFDIAIDSKGNVYASDPKLRRIQKFSEDGIVISSITVESPFFLTFDSQNILYVMEQQTPVRGMFTIVSSVTHNHFITMIHCNDEEMILLDEFQWSQGCKDYGCSARITMGRNGFMYVCDPFEGCVYVC